MKDVEFKWSRGSVNVYMDYHNDKRRKMMQFIRKSKLPYIESMRESAETYYLGACIFIRVSALIEDKERKEFEQLVFDYLHHKRLVHIPQHYKKLTRFLPNQPAKVMPSWARSDYV